MQGSAVRGLDVIFFQFSIFLSNFPKRKHPNVYQNAFNSSKYPRKKLKVISKRRVNENGKWSEGPTLKYKRKNHAVGIVTDEYTMEKIVFVTGGDGEDGAELKSTEKLLENSNTWSTGKNSLE